jgi:ribonucleoside-diphosphate reductase beta chain
MKYITNQRLRAIGYQKIFDEHSNPIPWIDSYLGNSKVEVAPQEVEISSYVIGTLNKTIPEEVWE